VFLIALLARGDQPRVAERGQFSLHCTLARLRQCDQLIGVIAAVRRAEQDSQHPLTDLGEQGVSGAGRNGCGDYGTQNGAYRTLFGVFVRIGSDDGDQHLGAYFPHESFNPVTRLNTGFPAA